MTLSVNTLLGEPLAPKLGVAFFKRFKELVRTF